MTPPPVPLGMHVGAAIGAALTGDVDRMRAACRAIVIEWGMSGLNDAVRLTARIAAMHADRNTADVWAPLVDDQVHPATVCARRIIAARINGDRDTVEALLVAAREHRYQWRLLLAAVATAAAAMRGLETAGGVSTP